MSEKTWAETIDPTIKRWEMRSWFDQCESVVPAEESKHTADTLKLLAERADTWYLLSMKAVREFKWFFLYGVMAGWWLAQVLNYLTF